MSLKKVIIFSEQKRFRGRSFKKSKLEEKARVTKSRDRLSKKITEIKCDLRRSRKNASKSFNASSDEENKTTEKQTIIERQKKLNAYFEDS